MALLEGALKGLAGGGKPETHRNANLIPHPDVSSKTSTWSSNISMPFLRRTREVPLVAAKTHPPPLLELYSSRAICTHVSSRSCSSALSFRYSNTSGFSCTLV